MRTPSFVKLLTGLAVVSLSACQCGPPEPALQVVITLDKDVAATCVVLEVSSGGTVRLSQELKRSVGKDSYRVGIKKLQLPTDLQLVARSFTSSTGAGCAEPRVQTSVSAPVAAQFPKSDVATVMLQIHAPAADLDADRDGHIAVGKGGDDCNDNDPGIHPGLPALCGSVLDNDCDGKIGCADSECTTAAICTMPPAALAFVTTAAPVSVNACSPALTVEVRDAASGPVVAAVDTVVSLGMNPQGGVGYYFDPLCLTSVTQVTIATGQSRASFYFKAAATGMFDATATINDVPTASQTQTVVQPSVAQLAFVNAPVSVLVNSCSAPLTLQTRDASGAAAPISGGASIALSSNQSGVTFYSDVTCATALPNNALAIAPGGSGGTFYVRATSAQATTLTATLATIPAVNQALTVTAGPATQLAFATSAQGVQSGACSNVVTVETRDAANNLAPVAAATTVGLSTTGVPVGLFADSNCTVPITARPLAAGASSVAFHFKGTTVGMAAITAGSAGLTSAMQTQSIGVGAPSKLVLSAAQSITAGQCSAAATVETQDVNGNPSNVTGTALAVTLTNPGAGLTFFSDAACTMALSGTLSIAVGGTSATFYFRGTTAGPQDVTASSTGLSPATQTHTLTAAAPSVLVFTSPAQSVPAGTCAQFDLEARDAFGNPAAPGAAATVTLTSTPAVTFSAAPGCAAPVTSVTLTGPAVSFFARSTVAGARTLTATAPFATATQGFTIVPGAATRLGFTVQPPNAAAGASLTPSVQVAVQDALGNTVTSSAANITLALATNPGAGVLSGTLTVAAVAGVATFSGLSIDKTGVGYMLGATSGTLTGATSAAFDIAAGPAAALTFTVQPTTTTAGAAINPAVQVTLVDALGNTVTASSANVTLAVGTNPSAGVLSGTTTVAAVAGVATLSGLSINRTGTGYTLTATSAALPAATSSAFNINAGTAAKVAFTTQPTPTVAGASIAPAVQVAIEDALGNIVTASTATVTVALGTNPGPGVLSGTLTAAAVAGVATFSGLSINRTGAGYTLGATSAGLTPATSTGFDITPGAPAQLVFVVQPVTTSAGAPLDPGPRVALEDALGNRVTSATSNVTIAIGTNPGAGVLSGTLTVAAVAGAATFSGLSINKAGAGYTLTATSGALPGTTSSAFNINPGAAAKLVFSVQPTSAVSTVVIAPSPKVTVEDALGNTVTSSTASIALAIANNPNGGTLSGTLTVAAVAGVATFNGLSIDKAGVGYTLGATSGALAPATSSAFTITAGAPIKLVILGAALSQPALDCSVLRTVELQDAGGNPAASVGTTVVSYAAAPTLAGTAFFSDSACTVATTGATRTIANGATQVSFYFSVQNATPVVTLTASSGSLTDGTQKASIAQATPTQLKFTTPPPQIEAGFCQALTLERQDVADRPTSPTTPTTVSRMTSPGSGISFFSDPACTTPLAATFDILSGASSTVVYVMGTTGATYSLTTSATGLTNGIINVVVLPMVRRGSCTLAATAQVTCPVTPAIPGDVISRTFLVFQAAGSGNTPDSANVSCRLTNTSGVNVVCDRAGAAGTAAINWQTVSFAQGFAQGGVTVEHLSGLFGMATANPINVPVAAVDLTKSFVLFSTASGGTANAANDFLTARLTSTTNVAISESAGATFTTGGGYALQVVSFAGANVVRGTATAAVGASSVPVTGLAASVVSRTFPLVTSRTSTTADDSAICKRKVRGVVTSATALGFTRGDGAMGSCVDADIAELAWERIELPAGNLVQSVTVAHANNAATGSASLAVSVDLTRSIVFMAGQGIGGQATGETNYASDDVVGALLGLASLDATGLVTVTRAATNLGTASFTPFVVQFVP